MKIDSKTKLIIIWHVTDASVHHSQALEQLIDNPNDKGQDIIVSVYKI